MNDDLRRRLGFLRPVVRVARRALRVVVRRSEGVLGRLLGARWFPLPMWLQLPLAHELTDPVALERLVERASGRGGSGTSSGVRRLLAVALVRLGRLALDRHDDADALRWFERLHDEADVSADTWTWQAVTLRRLGRLDESQAAGEAALDVDPEWTPAILHLGMLHIQRGDKSAAVGMLRRLLDAPRAIESELRWAWLGLDRIQEFELGLEVADRIGVVTGDGPWSHAFRAVSLMRLRRAADARRHVQELESSRRVEHVRARSFLLARTGHAGQARDLVRGLPVRHRGTDLLREVIVALREEGHLTLALDLADEAVGDHPRDGELAEVRRLAAGHLRVFSGRWFEDESRRLDAGSGAPTEPPTGPPESRGCDVLHVVGRTRPHATSGYAVRTDYTVRALRDAGVDVHVVSQIGFPWEDGHDAPSIEHVDGVPHHRLGFPEGLRLPPSLDERMTAHVDALAGLVERLRPGVLHASSDFRNGQVALLVGRRLGIPVIYEMRGFWEETWLVTHPTSGMDSDVYRMRRARETEVALTADRVITLAPVMRDELVERGIDPDRLSLAPNAVDPAGFPPVHRDDDLAARLGFAPDDVVVGYVSSFVAYEGIDTLIEAIALARDRGAPVRGLLVGDGVVRPELERRARELGIEDQVVFTGRVPHAEVTSYYGLIDVFVVPRTNARVCQLVSPLKPFEAMALERALIVSATPVLRDIVDDGRLGRTFTPEDPGQLADRIVELAGDPEERRRLGALARAHVLSNNTWAANAQRYLGVYESVGVRRA